MSRAGDASPTKTWWWFYFAVAAIAAAVAVALVLTYWSSSWGPNQWGPVAAWFSGLMTVVAVSVSLYQTKLARDDAAQAKLDAGGRLEAEQTRHATEMAAADQRLREQIGSQRQRDQVNCVADLWVHLHRLPAALLKLESALDDLPSIAAGRQKSELSYLELQPFEAAAHEWFRVYGEADMALSTAVMIIDEPYTERLLKSLVKKLLELQNAVEVATTELDDRFKSDQATADGLMMKVVKHRDPMMKCVRQHIVGTSPLSPNAPTHDPLAESE